MNERIEEEILHRYNRLVRNITTSHIHVSSEHKMNLAQVNEAVRLAAGITNITDPHAIKEKFISLDNLPPLTPRVVHVALVFTNIRLIDDSYKQTDDYPKDELVHKFLEGVAANAADNACANLFLINKKQRANFFEREHGSIEIGGTDHDIKGVCASPSLGRKWIAASEQALWLICPDLLKQAHVQNAKV